MIATSSLALARLRRLAMRHLAISVGADLSTREKRRDGVRENAEERDEHERDEDNEPDAQADPHRGPDAEEGTRGDGEGSDNELKEEDGKRELFEVIDGRVRPCVPL